MTRFANPKAAQAMMQTHGHTNLGMPPKPGFSGTAAPAVPVRGSIFGGGRGNPKPPVMPPPTPQAPTKSGFGALSAGEGRAMANRNPAPTGRFPTTKMKSGGKVSSASKRADGIAVKGKTKGKIV